MRLLASSIAALAVAHGAFAQQPLEGFSFGHKTGQSISPNSFAIPGFSILGEGYVPQLLSDKVVLTPPFGGNKKGAVWTENKNTLNDWKVDFGFRVAVTDQGSGTLQLWYTANGKDTVGTQDLYTVGRFDGLAIIIDTVGGRQKIRGFLNDGSVDYRSQNNIDSLAFGHCDYNYRNRGDPSHLTIKSSSTGGLDVTIDDQPCFSTDSVRLPTDYYFGMTSSSNDPPDSFEVFGFHLSTYTPPPITNQQQQSNQQHEPYQQRQADPNTGNTNPPNIIPANGAMLASPKSLAALETRLNDLYTLLERTNTHFTTQLEQLSSKLSQPIISSPDSKSAPTTAQLATLDSRLSDLSLTLKSLEKELKSGDHSTQFKKLSEQVREVHAGVTEHVPGKLREYMIAHTPRIGFILYSFMAFQCCCFVGWGWWRWRKSTLPKKYL